MELDFSEQIKKLFASKAEKTCPNCDKQMSMCKCDTSKSKMHPDKEDKKDKEMEKGDPNAEKDEEMKAKKAQESKDIKDIEKKGDMNSKAGKMCSKCMSKMEDTYADKMCKKCMAEMDDTYAAKSKDATNKDVEEDPKHEAGESQDEENKEDLEKMNKKTKAKNKIKSSLQNKIEKFNENNDRQITLAQVEEVFNRGLKAFDTNHRIGVSKIQWAFARVNSFFKMVSNQVVNTSYAKADSDILTNNFDSSNTEFSAFSDIEFQLAKISIIEAGLTDTELLEEVSFAAEDKKKVKL
jgi:hypothetical protein